MLGWFRIQGSPDSDGSVFPLPLSLTLPDIPFRYGSLSSRLDMWLESF